MKKWLRSILLLLLFVGFTAAVSTVDVKPIGPNGTAVGFAGINGFVHSLLGEQLLWYNLTELFGYLCLGVMAAFGLAGLVQLITRRSLFKVDSKIILLGVLYAATVALYVLFEKVVINYRPVIMPGELAPEASYPSSHTMLVCVVMGSASAFFKRTDLPGILSGCLRVLCWAVLLATVAGRLLSGVHWFTDILGGVLISLALLSFFDAGLHTFCKRFHRGGRYLQK